MSDIASASVPNVFSHYALSPVHTQVIGEVLGD